MKECLQPLKEFKTLALSAKALSLASKKYGFELERAESYFETLGVSLMKMKSEQGRLVEHYELSLDAMISGASSIKDVVIRKFDTHRLKIEQLNKSLSDLEQKCLDAKRSIQIIEKKLSMLKTQGLQQKKQNLWLQNYSH